MANSAGYAKVEQTSGETNEEVNETISGQNEESQANGQSSRGSLYSPEGEEEPDQSYLFKGIDADEGNIMSRKGNKIDDNTNNVCCQSFSYRYILMGFIPAFLLFLVGAFIGRGLKPSTNRFGDLTPPFNNLDETPSPVTKVLTLKPSILQTASPTRTHSKPPIPLNTDQSTLFIKPTLTPATTTRNPSSAPHSQEKSSQTPAPSPMPVNQMVGNTTIEVKNLIDPYKLAGISEQRRNFWKLQYEKKVAFKVELRKKYPYKNGQWDIMKDWEREHTEFCQSLNAEEERRFGYDEFHTKISTDCDDCILGFDIDALIKNVENFLVDLCIYYKPMGEICDLSNGVLPRVFSGEASNEEMDRAFRRSMRIHSWKFAKKLVHREKFRIGVLGLQGTSVLAGQDNCFKTSYGPGLENDLRNLMEPAIEVEVRTSAQNGDGPPMYEAITCADAIFNLNEIDSIHMSWVMGPQVPLAIHERTALSWMNSPRLILPFYITSFGFATNRIKYYDAGLVAVSGPFPGLKDAFPWWLAGRKSHWGRIGDGRCHLKCRDTTDAVYMQNWHPGPMKNQVDRDRTTFFYAQAFLKALKDVKDKLSKPGNNLEKLKEFWENERPPGFVVPSAQQTNSSCMKSRNCSQFYSEDLFCITGHGASWNGKYNISEWRIRDSKSPYPHLNDTKGNWHYVRLKGQSHLGGAQESQKAQEAKDPACTGHSDITYGYAARGSAGESWITFKIPRLSRGILVLCTTRNRRSIGIPLVKINGLDLEPGEEHPITPGSAKVCRVLTMKAPKNGAFYLSMSAKQGFTFMSIIGF